VGLVGALNLGQKLLAQGAVAHTAEVLKHVELSVAQPQCVFDGGAWTRMSHSLATLSLQTGESVMSFPCFARITIGSIGRPPLETCNNRGQMRLKWTPAHTSPFLGQDVMSCYSLLHSFPLILFLDSNLIIPRRDVFAKISQASATKPAT
jgi:hypothetical protein